MRAEEITDEITLRKWLATKLADGIEQIEQRRWAVAIAHRAAMRVLPLARSRDQTKVRDYNLSALTLFNLSLISGVASICPTPEISAVAAFTSYNDDNLYPDDAEFPAVEDAGSALAAATTYAAAVAVAADVAYAAAASTYYADFAAAAHRADSRAALWMATRSDCIELESGCLQALYPCGWKQIRSTILGRDFSRN